MVAGRIVAGKLIKLACRRQLEDLDRVGDPEFPYRFDARHASDICDFVEKLPHVEGRWATATITLEPWQVFVLSTVFGWRRVSDGGRRFEQAYIEVARKNAKSALSSGVSLYCLTCEGEIGPQVKTAATTGSQARIVFDVASKMAKATPDLCEAFGLEVFANGIVCGANGGGMQPINAKSSTQDGLNPHLRIIDELHAHKDRSLFDVLRSATGARKNPLGWYITTAGYNIEGVAYEQRTYVTKLLDRTLTDETYFGAIYTLDEGDDAFDEAVWLKANPNLGVSVNLNEMRSHARQAKASPAAAGDFKTKKLNLWLNSGSPWLDIQQWRACRDEGLVLEDFTGEPVALGVDLASKNDVAAAGLLFRRDGLYYGFCRFYLPEDLVDSFAHRQTAHYRKWADQGFITLTPGNITDYAFIERDIREWCQRFRVRSVAFDPYQSNQIATALTTDGLPAVLYGQTVKNMSEPAKEFAAHVETGKFRHDGNPMLTWMASNVYVQEDWKGNILPRKDKRTSANKIDGIVALIMAMGRLLLDQQGPVGDDAYRVVLV